jgi:hypothetical protein
MTGEIKSQSAKVTAKKKQLKQPLSRTLDLWSRQNWQNQTLGSFPLGQPLIAEDGKCGVDVIDLAKGQ